MGRWHILFYPPAAGGTHNVVYLSGKPCALGVLCIVWVSRVGTYVYYCVGTTVTGILINRRVRDENFSTISICDVR